MTPQNNKTQIPDIEVLFQLRDSRFGRILEWARLSHRFRVHAGRVATILAISSWIPLLVLSAIEGVAWGDRVTVPLLKDFLSYGQFLLAVPVLVLGEGFVSKRIGWAVSELRQSGILVSEDTPELDKLLARVIELWQGWIVNAVFLLLTGVITVPLWCSFRRWCEHGRKVSCS